MLVVCPKCFTQYVVPDEHRLPEGQKFHCSACHNYFYLNSGEQNGFYDNENGESDIIPTVTSVMTKTKEPNIQPTQPIISQQKTNRAEQVVPVENALNIKPADIYAEPTVTTKKQSTEPMSMLANERPHAYDRLDSLPEEFKPVTQQEKKKTSAFSLIFWLCVASGICYFAYSQKDFLIQQIDQHIIGALDEQAKPAEPQKKQVEKVQKQEKSVTEKKETTKPETKKDETKSAPKQAVQPATTVKDKATNQQTSQKETTKSETKKDEIKSAPKQAVQPAKTVKDKATNQQTSQKETTTVKQIVQSKEVAPNEKVVVDVKPQTQVQPEKEPQQTQPESVISEKTTEKTEPIKEKPVETTIQTPVSEITDVETEKSQPTAIQNETEKTSASQPEPKSENVISETPAEQQPIKPIEENIEKAVQEQVVSDEQTNSAESKTESVQQESTKESISEQNESQPENKEILIPLPSINSEPSAEEQKELTIQKTSSENILLSGDQNQPIVVRETIKVSNSYTDLEPVSSLPTSEANRILKIQDISYEISENEAGMMRLMIKGVVANTELEKVTIPELKAVVYNNEDMVVARKRIILSQPEIEGNSTQEFFSSVVPAPEQVSHVEVLFDE